MPICISGMHRSGTSMVAHLLNLCGVYLGPEEELGAAAPDNPEGFWENVHIKQLNEEILAALGGGWDIVPIMSNDWDLQPVMIPLRARAAELIERLSLEKPWGWKDPRNSLTLPFWKRLLPDLKVVICLRNPLDVAQSLQKRGFSSLRFGLELWHSYYQRLLLATHPEGRIVTHYDAYFYDAKAELSHVLNAANLYASAEVIEEACKAISFPLRHTKSGISDLLQADVPFDVLKTYMDLCTEAGPVFQLALQQEPHEEIETTSSQDPARHEYQHALQMLRVQAKLAEQTQTTNILRAQLAIREQSIVTLQEQIGLSDKTVAVLQEQIVVRDQTVAALQEQVAILDESMAVLQAQSAEREKTVEALENRADQRERDLKALDAQIIVSKRALDLLETQAAKQDWAIQTLVAQVGERQQVVDTLSNQLTTITNSTGWGLVTQLWRIRYWLAPHGSTRNRIGWAIMRGLRLWRHQGTHAFLSHVGSQLRRGKMAIQADLSPPVTSMVEIEHSAPKSVPQRDLNTVVIPTNYDVVCFPIIEWDHRFQRPQQLMTLFAEEGHRIFYLRLTFHDHGDQVKWWPVTDYILQIQLPGPTQLNRFLEQIPVDAVPQLLQALCEFCEQAGIRDAICMVQLPFWAPLALGLGKRYGWKVVFDCMDEHEGLTILRPEMLRDEAILVRESDLVLTSAQKLWDKHSGQARRCLRLPNGADFDHFSRPSNEALLTDLPHPIIGYYGAIMDWFDADMVHQAAMARPCWSFVLIGNVDTSSVKPLQQLPNVHFIGEQHYARLPAYLQQFDVALIPFKLTAIIQSTNPVKFYEYLSAGKPVVAAPMPELLPYRDLFYPASDGQALVTQVEKALSENNSSRVTARMAWAHQHTWQARYETLSAAINNLHGLVSIVIVSYNHLDHIRACLDSILQKTQYPCYEVIIVDNASTSDVVEYLQTLKDVRVRVIFNAKNMGFAPANNIGLQTISNESEYIVLLNNDTVVTRGWLTTLTRWLNDPAVGLVGPVTWPYGASNEAALPVHYNNMDEMETVAANYTAQHRGVGFDIPVLAMYCVAMRRIVFDEIGLLDEQFEVGMFEDDDYAMRIKQHGYRVLCAEDVFIHHVGRASFSQLNEQEYQRIFQANLRRYEAKWNTTWTIHSGRENPVGVVS